jgi:hypothetical protein
LRMAQRLKRRFPMALDAVSCSISRRDAKRSLM